MSKKPKKIVIEQDPEEPVEKKVLAQSIVEISKSFRKLASSGLNDRAIVVLVSESSHVGKPDVRAVLESLKWLEGEYT